MRPRDEDWAAALRTMGVAVAVARLDDGRLLEVNPAFVRLTGQDAPTLEGTAAWDVLAPFGEADWQALRSALEEGTGQHEVETSLVRPDGQARMLLLTAAPTTFAGEACTVLTLVDLTRQKAVQDALRLSEERHRIMVEQVHDYAIFMLDPQGRVTTWNEGAHRAKGYSALEILGKHFEVFYPPEDRAVGLPRRVLQEAIEKGSTEHEGWRVRKDGTKFWGNVVLTALRNAEGELVGFVKVTRDITHRRQQEEAERQAFQSQVEVAKLKELAELKNAFLNMSAHELLTPLSPLTTVVQIMALDEVVRDPVQVKRYVAILERNLTRLQRLIQDLLDASRLDSKRMVLKRKDADLGTLARQAGALFQAAAQAKGVALEVVPDGPAPVHVDADRIMQVIDNLVSNAIKFTPKGGHVRLAVSTQPGEAALEVADDGLGMEAAFLGKIFQPFSRSDAAANAPGTGLGLYVARGIVELHGGRIAAASDGPGKGARFRVTLPLAPRAKAKETTGT